MSKIIKKEILWTDNAKIIGENTFYVTIPAKDAKEINLKKGDILRLQGRIVFTENEKIGGI